MFLACYDSKESTTTMIVLDLLPENDYRWGIFKYFDDSEESSGYFMNLAHKPESNSFWQMTKNPAFLLFTWRNNIGMINYSADVSTSRIIELE